MFQWSINGKKVSDEEFLYRTAKFLPKPEWISLCKSIDALHRERYIIVRLMGNDKNLSLKDMEVQ